jgi:hypothetical protein
MIQVPVVLRQNTPNVLRVRGAGIGAFAAKTKSKRTSAPCPRKVLCKTCLDKGCVGNCRF